MSTPVNHFGGKCPCIPFFIGGGQISEGGNVLHSLRKYRPKRPTELGRNDPGPNRPRQNDPGRNDPGPKQLRAETTLG